MRRRAKAHGLRETGIEVDSIRDAIAYKGGEQSPGVGLGLITIVVHPA